MKRRGIKIGKEEEEEEEEEKAEEGKNEIMKKGKKR